MSHVGRCHVGPRTHVETPPRRLPSVYILVWPDFFGSSVFIPGFRPHRASAARRTICLRFQGRKDAALAGPPFAPPRRQATAAGFLPSSTAAVNHAPPVARQAGRGVHDRARANMFTSRGFLAMLERFGIALQLALGYDVILKRGRATARRYRSILLRACRPCDHPGSNSRPLKHRAPPIA